MSTTTAEPSVEEILAQMETAEKAPEPGTMRVRDVLHRGDEDAPAPIVASALKSAGYTFVWDRKSGERSLTNRNMLPTQLKKRNQDGTLVFTTTNPGIAAKAGAVKCWLHADSPDRAEWDAMGLPICTKANLGSPHQAELHMKHRHPSAYDAIKDAREKREKEMDRQLQRDVIASIAASRVTPKAAKEPKGKSKEGDPA